MCCRRIRKLLSLRGAVTKVEMHNELRDTPKTGDDSNPTLWIALMGIAAVGAVTCGVFGIKNKKKRRMLNNGRKNRYCHRAGRVHSCGVGLLKIRAKKK